MTIPMDCAISSTAGHVFALAAHRAIAEDPQKARVPLRRGRVFTVVATIPIGLYFLVRWPDWSWAYFAGDRSGSPVLGTLGIVGYFLSHEIGFRHAARLIAAGRTRRAFVYALLSFVSFGLVVVLGWNRFRWQGTCEEFEAGTARDALFSPDFIIPLAAGVLYFFLGSLIVVVLNWRRCD